MRLRRVDDAPHLPLLLLAQVDVPRRPVLLESLGLGRAGDGDHALGGDPGEGDLRQAAPLSGSELLDLVDDGLVLVKVFALELWACWFLVGFLLAKSKGITLCWVRKQSPEERERERGGELTSAPEIIGGKVIGALETEVVDKPAVAKRAVGDVGDAELPGRLDQPVGLVNCFEG